MTITTELTPGQQRTKKARDTRARLANERTAARLRAAGYVVVPARGLEVLRSTMIDRVDRSPWCEGFVAGVEAVLEVSTTLKGIDGA